MMGLIQAKANEIKKDPSFNLMLQSKLQSQSQQQFRKEYSVSDFRTTMMSQRNALLKKRQ